MEDMAVERSLAAHRDISEFLGDCTKRVGVVGDVHGELQALKEILRALGFIDSLGDWFARDGTLVLTGDAGTGAIYRRCSTSSIALPRRRTGSAAGSCGRWATTICTRSGRWTGRRGLPRLSTVADDPGGSIAPGATSGPDGAGGVLRIRQAVRARRGPSQHRRARDTRTWSGRRKDSRFLRERRASPDARRTGTDQRQGSAPRNLPHRDESHTRTAHAR